MINQRAKKKKKPTLIIGCVGGTRAKEWKKIPSLFNKKKTVIIKKLKKKQDKFFEGLVN